MGGHGLPELPLIRGHGRLELPEVGVGPDSQLSACTHVYIHYMGCIGTKLHYHGP